jgi:palmitoyl-protein thioesterase
MRPPPPAAALLFLATAAAILSLAFATPPPVVMWHGMGDTCCNPLSMGKIQKEIETALPGIRVLSLQIGASESEDAENGFFMPIAHQVAIACAAIKNASYLSSGYNAIGFSQGAQFLRAVAQQCDASPPMLSLISVGGQHRGVYGVPRCLGANHTLCDVMREPNCYDLALCDAFGAYGERM